MRQAGILAFAAEDGTLPLADVAAAIKPDDIHFARTRLLSLENTHHGRVLPLGYLEQAWHFTRERGLALHIDGARALEAEAAAISGKEAALFFPTGTQANLVALLCHCQRGDEYIVGQQAHNYKYEAGGAAVLGSIQPQPIQPTGCGKTKLLPDRR
ncbi:hypothetical protein CRX72_13045 [Pantoea sp. BRM17]|nr:hypothetical protein CRX72_13045 [Pantoea sp. BRM17]